MKNTDKIIIVVLIIVITVLSIRLIAINQYDINRDGVVNSKDLLDLRKYLINKN